MNKYLIIGAGALVVLVAAWALMGNNATKKVQVSPTPTIVSSPSAEPVTKEAMVNLTKEGFEPGTITIKVGTKVTWVNKSGETAAVNSAVHPTHLLYPFLNLGTFNDGESLSVTFDKAGTYKYHDHLNPSETGEVVVE